LVLVGIVFGFSLALLSFSCISPGNGMVARAQEMAPRTPIPQGPLAVAVDLQTAFNAVADRMLPSVVEVKTVSIQRRQSQNYNGIPWEFFFGPRGGDRNEGQEREYRSSGLGSGIIVKHEKNTYYVLTNNHVVENTNEIVIATKEGQEYEAKLVGKDSRRDLAIVSFETNDSYPLAELGNSDEVKVGDWAIAMGNPLGNQFAFSVTMGIVSAVGRQGGPGGNINDFIQTDASINQGNSGGPLVNIYGQVIGINTWIASNAGGGSVGLGFAIPINNAKRAIDEIIASGGVNDGWLGVSLIDADRETLQALGLSGRRGSLAAQVFLGSPADKGGICPGDFITHVDKREVRGTNQLMQMVGDLRPGESAVFTLLRDGSSKDVTVRIEARTDAVASETRRLWPGLFLVTLTDEIRSSLRLEANAEGLYVREVIDETPAKIVGLARGDRIITVNDTPVKDLASFYKILREKADKELWFGFIRGESTLESLKYKR